MKKVLYFDVETTGLSKTENDIVQLAYILEVDGEIKHTNNIWIKPVNLEAISQEALDVIGKTREELMTGIEPKEAHKIFTDDLGKVCDKFDRSDKFYPAGYNVAFDLDFLSEFFKKQDDKYLGSWINWKSIDSLPIMRWLDFKGKLTLKNYKLATVCEHYGIWIDAHDALSDVTATRQLIRMLSNPNEKHDN